MGDHTGRQELVTEISIAASSGAVAGLGTILAKRITEIRDVLKVNSAPLCRPANCAEPGHLAEAIVETERLLKEIKEIYIRYELEVKNFRTLEASGVWGSDGVPERTVRSMQNDGGSTGGATPKPEGVQDPSRLHRQNIKTDGL